MLSPPIVISVFSMSIMGKSDQENMRNNLTKSTDRVIVVEDKNTDVRIAGIAETLGSVLTAAANCLPADAYSNSMNALQ